MKLDKTQIKNSIEQVVKKWDYSGHFILMKGNNVLHNDFYGYENKEKNVKTSKDTRYLVDSECAFFAKIAILMEISKKTIKFKDYINQYIPELNHGEKITIYNLLNDDSGLFDYFHSSIMVQFETDEKLKALSEHDRVRKEQFIMYENRDFDTVLGIINDKELEYEPGKDDEGSSTNSVLLVELLKRTTGQTPFEYLKEHVFDVLNMTSVQYGSDINTLSYVEHNMKELISTPIEGDIEGAFSMTAVDIQKLFEAFIEKQLFTETVWKKALKQNKDGESILFGNASGYVSTGINIIGFGIQVYFDFEKKITYAVISNQQQLFEFVDNNWYYMNKDIRYIVSTIMTYPEKTKMVKLNKKNFWGALDLSVEDEQNKYVLNAKSSVAMGLFNKTQKVFVQMEGDIAVGLLVLNIDKKKNIYYIEIIIIDKKYQNKGFGKLMVKWAVEYLKEAGAKKLSIGVDRENIAAKKVYINAGFKPKSVYDGGMELEMKL